MAYSATHSDSAGPLAGTTDVVVKFWAGKLHATAQNKTSTRKARLRTRSSTFRKEGATDYAIEAPTISSYGDPGRP